jgi:hypothetical protein
MKAKLVVSIIGLALAPFAPFAIADEKNDKKEKHDDHDHEGHDHGAHGKQGPNHGKLITEVEPHLEFLVTKDGKVQLTFVDDHNKVVAIPEAGFSMVCGNRAKPTKMSFKKVGKGYISKEKLPAGKNIPTVLSVKPGKDAKTKTVRLNVNLNDCPSCDYLEYACTCEH